MLLEELLLFINLTNKKVLILFGFVILFGFNGNLISQNCIPSDSSYAWPTHSNWFVGKGNKISFGSNGTTAPVASNINASTWAPVYESTAAASDINGNLLLFTNGVKLFDGSGVEISVPGGRLLTGAENSSGLEGSAVQGVFITKHPLDSENYYIFTTDDAISGAAGITNGFNYYIYNITTKDLSGPQRLKNKLGTNFRPTEQVSGTFHQNGVDIWISTHESTIGGSQNFLSYLLKCEGLDENPVESKGGFEVISKTGNERASLNFSWDGTKAAANYHSFGGTYDPASSVTLLDFDNSRGEFSNPTPVSPNDNQHGNPYDCEFSPSGNRLFVSYQCETGSELGYVDVATNAYTPAMNFDANECGALKLGGDGKIYTGTFTFCGGWMYGNSIGAISDLDGTPSYNGDEIITPFEVGWGLGNMFIPPQDNFNIKDTTGFTTCDSVDIQTIWKCANKSAENTDDNYSLAENYPNAGINPKTGNFKAEDPGTYKIYFQICTLKDSLEVNVISCDCNVNLGKADSICVGETFLLDTTVKYSSGTGVWTIDSIPNTPGITATVNNSGSDTLFDASPLNTKHGTYKLKYQLGDNTPPNCLDFDGNNDYVNMGDVNDLGTLDFTIEGWFYLDDTLTTLGYVIVNKGLTSVGVPSNAGYQLRTSRDSGDELVFTIGNSDGNVTKIHFNGVSPKRWHHAVGVREGKKMYLYLDGVLVAQGSTPSVYNVNTNIPFCIGAMNKGGLSADNYFLNGKIDEVRIWDASKSSVEINRIKDCAVISQESNLVASYNLNETSGIVANDASNNANHGTLMDGPVWVSSDVAQTCNSCHDSLYLTVNSLKDATINVLKDTLSFCILDQDTVLSVKESGGTWIKENGVNWNGITQVGKDVTFDIKTLTNNGAINLDTVMFIYKHDDPCGDEDTIWIATTSKLDATIKAINPFCEKDSPVYLFDSLNVKDFGAGKFFGIGISIPDSGRFDPSGAYNLATGPYKIEYRIAGTCGDTGEVYIEVNPLPDPTITNIKKEFCENHGKELLLSKENGDSWQWRHLNNQQKGIDTSDISDPLFNTLVSDTGTFDLEYSLTTLKGCSDTDTVRFVVLPIDTPKIDSIGPLCEGSSALNLVASPAGGVWSDLNDGNGITVSSSGSFNPVSDGTDSIVYTINQSTCPASDTIVIIVNDIPQTSFSILKRTDCPPMEIEFKDNSVLKPDSSFWDFGNDSTSSEIDSTFNSYDNPGCYDILLTNFYNNCTSAFSSQICSAPKPVADFSWSPELLDVDNSQAIFQNKSSDDAFSFEWDFTNIELPSKSNPITTAEVSNLNAENPVVIFNSSNGDVINVELKVTNSNGCSDSVTKPVTIIDKFSVILPNAFTPNDDDVNDEFFPVGRNLQIGANYDFRIYNRWGTLIWMSKTPNEGWDGRVTEMAPSGGKIAQIDVYVWRLTVVDPFTGQEKKLFGTVTLMQ